MQKTAASSQTDGDRSFCLPEKESEDNFSTLPVQAKLTVGSPDDPYEREANAVADRVMRMTESNFIQRKCAECEKKELHRMPISHVTTPFLQTKTETTVTDGIAASIQSSRGSGSALDADIGSFMSNRFGHDFSSVKIHTDSQAIQLSRGLNAKAFTVGNDVYFNEGQYRPGSSEGKHLLAHELTHVVQQQGLGFSSENSGVYGKTNESNIIQRSSTTFVEGGIQGHASPRWEHRGGRSRQELNLQLSRDRANAVECLFKEMFQRQMHGQGEIQFSITCTSEDHRDPSIVSIPTLGLGQSQTLVEAGGDIRANERSMRRADINIIITKQIEGVAGRTESVVIPEECEENATDRWAIKMSLGGGAGHLGLGGTFAIGQLKNRRTGQVAQGSFLGGGIGVGLQTPGADPGWGDWVNFTTEDICTFADFDNTLARLTTAGGGIAIVGYSLAWISFPMRGANSIYVGGFNMGALGADAGSNVGNWNIHGTPPGPRCTPEHTIAQEGFSSYQYDIQDPLRHTVYFNTGSSEINDEQFHLLHGFVQHITSRYSSEE